MKPAMALIALRLRNEAQPWSRSPCWITDPGKEAECGRRRQQRQPDSLASPPFLGDKVLGLFQA